MDTTVPSASQISARPFGFSPRKVLLLGRPWVISPAGYTARMERTHGELCARFSDGLCRHDTDRLADIDSLPGSQTSSITFSADADGTLQVSTERILTDSIPDFSTVSACASVISSFSPPEAFLSSDDKCLRWLFFPSDSQLQRFDNLLPSANARTSIPSSVPQSISLTITLWLTSTRRLVRYPESAVLRAVSDSPLPGAVGGDEVVQNRKTFAEIRRDRNLDGLTGSVGHETSHTADLLDLVLASRPLSEP